MTKLRCVFMGTPEFSVPTLHMLNKHPEIELVSVISMPDRKKGRGQKLQSPEVIEYAKENQISYFQTTNINKEEDYLESLKNIDIIIVLAFAQFLGSKILNLPKIGCFNIHTSILPKYRGAAPIQYALLNGDKETGVSIQKMVKKMDAGDIVAFREVTIAQNETGGSLHDKLKEEAAICLNEFVDIILKNEIIYTPQSEEDVTFAPTLKKDDGYLNFKELDFENCFNKVRALFPWPGTYCYLNGKRLKILSIEKDSQKIAPGSISTKLNTLSVGCIDGSVRLSQVQLEGKKICSDFELLNGFRNNQAVFNLTDSEGNSL